MPGNKYLSAYLGNTIAVDSGECKILLLMECCSGGTLEDFLLKQYMEPLSETKCLQIFYDICQGVKHLHSQNSALVHGSLQVFFYLK